MCGIFGLQCDFLGDSARESFVSSAMISLASRGPDSNGVWSSECGKVVLGHTRLSILDLSNAGHQPMLSDCERYVLTFNGEIYNHLEIRAIVNHHMPGIKWRGHSDTETILRCFTILGASETLRLMTGMFALAFLDRATNILTLARDRLGEKPLYWGDAGGQFVFGSDLSIFKAAPSFPLDIDRNVLSMYLRYGYVAAPHSIYKNIYKLMPGSYMEVSLGLGGQKKVYEYWSLKGAVEVGLRERFQYDQVVAIDTLGELLTASVGRQMSADVPVGAFLSGGIDSTAVVSMMVQASSRTVQTFAIGFEDPDFNEAGHAAAVAKVLGTEHTELIVTSQDALKVIPNLPNIYSEPLADSSQIPTYLVSQMARAQVAVALSGDGGDELFGGYNPYLFMPRYWNVLSKVPLAGRKLAAILARGVTTSDRLLKLSEVMGATTREQFYKDTVSLWLNPESVVKDGKELPSALDNIAHWPKALSYEEWMMVSEMSMYMPDDILVKVDRAAMANSLETRVPLLDHKIVEFALSLPLSMKINNGQGKWILRELVNRYVSRSIMERPKKGFAVPVATWLRTDLREWAEHLLDERLLIDDGYFNVGIIRRAWREHLSMRRDHSRKLWVVLMFQAWLHRGV